MITIRRRRRKIEQLLQLAQAYRDCNRKELGKLLGRDATKLVPGLGNPKLDLVIGLARSLEWPVDDVVAFIWSEDHPDPPDGRSPADALTQVDTRLEPAAEADADPEQLARNCLLGAARGADAGRFLPVVESATRGMRIPGVSSPTRRRLQVELARAYYHLWALVEARCVSQDLLDSFRHHPPRTAPDRATHAAAYDVSGHTYRRLITIEPQRASELATRARHDLRRAWARYRRLAREEAHAALRGPANTCCGGLIETDVELGRRGAVDALERLSAGLDRVRDTARAAPGELESYGWWCIFGCNIALRHLEDPRELQKHMAVLTNKADEIADRLDHWPLRERVFTIQYTRWERSQRSATFDLPSVIDDDDVRIITGSMGRFPAFRETGWRILQTAQYIGRRFGGRKE